MNLFDAQLLDILDETQILRDEPMNKHTTMRVGGKASYFIESPDEDQIRQVVQLCRECAVNYDIIGNGSNLLFGDGGYQGVIIGMLSRTAACQIENCTITAKAGVLLSKIAREAQQAGLTGFEAAAGIPGTLGGALVMNAGAYGTEMNDVLRWVKVLTPEGEIIQLTASELQLGYRTSCILSAGYIVLEACLQLAQGEPELIKARMDELALSRRTKQPLEYPSAGSTFKRPPGYFAAKLIDDAGLRGFQIGGAQVSEKHCGFVINKDQATARDILNLCEQVSNKVKAQFDVELELEMKILGDL